MDFYKSKKWIETKDRILRRDGYMCQIARQYGRSVQADLVHHIFPRGEFPEYEFEEWNLISVSRSAHNALHDRNTDELTEKGVELLQRIARKYRVQVPERYTGKIRRKTRHESRARY